MYYHLRINLTKENKKLYVIKPVLTLQKTFELMAFYVLKSQVQNLIQELKVKLIITLFQRFLIIL